YSGFSPKMEPELIATYKLPEGGHALAIPKAMDRDRAIDESGNQLAVFGRIGARPLNLKEQHKMYLRDGKVWTVEDDPRSKLYQSVPRRRGEDKHGGGVFRPPVVGGGGAGGRGGPPVALSATGGPPVLRSLPRLRGHVVGVTERLEPAPPLLLRHRLR